MKSLGVIRHAKSSWGDASLDDFDRPLNQRGLQAAPLVGDALATRIGTPDIILSSTALRAHTTADIIAGKLGYPVDDIIGESQIYLASTACLFQVLREIDESHGSVMIFGHVPGVHHLSNSLCPAANIAHFPTCGAALIKLDIEHWGEINKSCGELVDFLIPRELPPIT